MTKITTDNHTTRTERFIAMSIGEYWEAKESLPEVADAGQAVLVTDIDYIDDAPHTIHVRPHPSKIGPFNQSHKYLVDNFLNAFMHTTQEQAGQEREKAVKVIQERLQEEQDEMQKAFTNTTLMDTLIDKELPRDASGDAQLPVKLETFGADVVQAVKTQQVTSLMKTGLTATGIEQIRSSLNEQKTIAERRSEWIQLRTKRLGKIAESITPFMEEKAALAMAVSRRMAKHVDELMKGIGSLNLYVLKDVEIVQLSAGNSADESLPLTITQRVLFMDEEMAVWADVDESFDYEKRERFFETLGENTNLRDQIFPTERCVVSIAASRRHFDYSGYDVMTQARKARENKVQFLVVRDGENVYAVLSPELFHQFSRTLFPTRNETESVFRGFDGQAITYRDLDYTASVKRHDAIALGYKRLLILLCGLDHNKQLFGKFYDGEPSMNFVSLAFQESHFRFIHDVDGDGALPSHRPQDMQSWLTELNREIDSGSRVLIVARHIISPETCPSAFRRSELWNDDPYMQYTPTEAAPLTVVKKQGDKLITSVELTGFNNKYEERTFNATLDLTEYQSGRGAGSDAICIDRLNPDEAHYYLHDRKTRTTNISGIRLLKVAIKHAQEERKKDAPVRTKLSEAIAAANIEMDKAEAQLNTDKAIAVWKRANPQTDINTLCNDSKKFHALCDQIFALAGAGDAKAEQIITRERKDGRTPIRVSIKPNGQMIAYSSLLPSECDDRILSEHRVCATTYRLSKKGIAKTRSALTTIKAFNNKETILFEASDYDFNNHSDAMKMFPHAHSKSDFFDAIDDAARLTKEVADIIREKDSEAAKKLFSNLCEDYFTFIDEESEERVEQPYSVLPIKAVAADGEANTLCLEIKTQHLLLELLHIINSDTLRDDFFREVSELYHSDYVQKQYDRLKAAYIDIGKTSILSRDIYFSAGLDFGLIVSEAYVARTQALRSKYAGWSADAIINEKFALQHTPEGLPDSVDALLGRQKPENFKPVMVIQQGSFASEDVKFYVFNFTEDMKEDRYFNGASYRETQEGVMELVSTSYQQSENGKTYDIKLGPVKLPTEEYRGRMPEAVYGREIISKIERKN